MAKETVKKTVKKSVKKETCKCPAIKKKEESVVSVKKEAVKKPKAKKDNLGVFTYDYINLLIKKVTNKRDIRIKDIITASKGKNDKTLATFNKALKEAKITFARFSELAKNQFMDMTFEELLRLSKVAGYKSVRIHLILK